MVSHRTGAKVALLTLVSVKGSAYRRPGARMMMAESGQMLGTLSGGCLEGDLYLRAGEAWRQDAPPSIQRYDLTEDEMWGLGIGCKGKVEILLEPLNPEEPIWGAFGRALQDDQAFVWAANWRTGGRLLLMADGSRTTRGEAPDWTYAEMVVQGPGPGFEGDWWWDMIEPPERLILTGAGHDAKPLARLAHRAGFELTVLDPREAFNNAEHFPEAVSHYLETPADINPEAVAGAYWVIMDHHQRRDEEALRLASQSRARYIGVLGPKSRTDEMLEKLGLSAGDLPIRAPVGLDLGAETPDEVAISIVAELMATRNGAPGGPLHGRERIHR